METRNTHISIPKRSISSLLLLMVAGTFTWLQTLYYIIPGYKALWVFLQNDVIDPSAFGLVWVPIVGYALATLNIWLVVRIFKQPKTCEEKGLVRLLRFFFFAACVLSLAFDLVGLLFAPTFYPWLIIVAPVMFLAVLMPAGFFMGFIVGLIRELSKP